MQLPLSLSCTINKDMNTKSTFLALFLLAALVFSGCERAEIDLPRTPPTAIPAGILAERVPENADILFVSTRYVFNDPACLDENYQVKENFINDLSCNRLIYNPELDVLAAPRQIYALDRQSGEAVQLTNLECDFSSLKPIDPSRLMAAGMCEDTDGDGLISTKDEPGIHLVDLAAGTVECLSCGLGLVSINNPDFSIPNQQIVFSAQREDRFHNYLFTLGLDGDLAQLTWSDEYMDFDCSWSEDGQMIVFNRLPQPFLSLPSQVWLMNSDGSGLQQITAGGANTGGEGPHGPYPIGLDADPDLSPDNSQIAFSRLRTGLENEPFGVYELVVVDVASKEVTILDSTYANMVPEWKEGGILFIRQIGSDQDLMERKQSIYLYTEGRFENLEPGFDVFPIGSNGASWVE